MRQFKPREVTRFQMPDGELLKHCRCLMRNRQYSSPEMFAELYEIVKAAMAKLSFRRTHAEEVAQEVTQDCIYKFLWYAIPRIVTSAPFLKRINCHSFLFQSAYFVILQAMNTEKRRERKSLSMDMEDVKEQLGNMVFVDGEVTVTREDENDRA